MYRQNTKQIFNLHYSSGLPASNKPCTNCSDVSSKLTNKCVDLIFLLISVHRFINPQDKHEYFATAEIFCMCNVTKINSNQLMICLNAPLGHFVSKQCSKTDTLPDTCTYTCTLEYISTVSWPYVTSFWQINYPLSFDWFSVCVSMFFHMIIAKAIFFGKLTANDGCHYPLHYLAKFKAI